MKRIFIDFKFLITLKFSSNLYQVRKIEVFKWKMCKKVFFLQDLYLLHYCIIQKKMFVKKNLILNPHK